MKIISGIGCEQTSEQNYFYNEYFNCKIVGMEIPLCFQDMIHLLTKLRNRILRPTALLPFGNGSVSKTFLKILIDSISKDKHCLTHSDIDPKDRQNALSASKICNTNTRDCLTNYVPGSQVTVLYLKMMSSVTESMLDPNLTIRKIRKIIKNVLWFIHRTTLAIVVVGICSSKKEQGECSSFYRCSHL